MCDVVASTLVTVPASPNSISLFLVLAACCLVGRCVNVSLIASVCLEASAPAAVIWKHVRPLSSRAARATLQYGLQFHACMALPL